MRHTPKDKQAKVKKEKVAKEIKNKVTKSVMKGDVSRKKAGHGIRRMDEESGCTMSVYDLIKEQAAVLSNVLWI